MRKLFGLVFVTCFVSNLCFAQVKIRDAQTINDLHQQMKNGQLTSVALVQFYLDRINKIDKNNATLNAVSQLNQHALQQAKSLDEQFIKRGFVGPLHGIPVLLKDNIDTLDNMANTAGSHALANNFPENNAFFVTQLIKAGAIILGKTNLSEWANFRSTSSSSGWSGLHGQTLNPYDLSTSPCGSSSGSGVAIAANLATVAVGTETDGSVTCPSAINGIVGIKPTLGTVSRSGIIPIAHSQDTAGPMARTVTDAVILLSAMVAEDPQDPEANSSVIDYLSHLKTDGLSGKRIGVVRNLMGYHKKLDAQFEQAIETIKAQGAIIVDNTNFENMEKWGEAEFTVLLYEFKNDLNKYLANTAKGLPKSLTDIINHNQQNKSLAMPYFDQEIMIMANEKGPLTDKDYLEALTSSKKMTQENGIDLLLKTHNLDLLIAPTTGPAWKIDHINGDHYLGAASSAAAISGYPHITVPMGFVHHLPVGISFIGGKLQEGKLIEAAFSYEQATQHRKPPSFIPK
ncbi:amidase [Thalassotalea sp. SU-HH00458]|uniref:amidase n=1 Tax=Thalassotalea sp. SU-HH00458 TaxID=3127657 RepID=UPI0033658725